MWFHSFILQRAKDEKINLFKKIKFVWKVKNSLKSKNTDKFVKNWSKLIKEYRLETIDANTLQVGGALEHIPWSYLQIEIP